MKAILAALSCVVIGLSSCTVPCQNQSIGSQFTGYDSTELTAVTIVRQKKGTLQPVAFIEASTTIPLPGNAISITHYDRDSLNYFVNMSLDPNYDYQFIVKSSGRVYSITGINIPHGSTYDTNHGCVSAAEWSVDGVKYSTHQYTVGASLGESATAVLSK